MMSEILDVKKLLFSVSEDQLVFLHLGPVTICVCEYPEHFDDFIRETVEQLNTIRDEIVEHHM